MECCKNTAWLYSSKSVFLIWAYHKILFYCPHLSRKVRILIRWDVPFGHPNSSSLSYVPIIVSPSRASTTPFCVQPTTWLPMTVPRGVLSHSHTRSKILHFFRRVSSMSLARVSLIFGDQSIWLGLSITKTSITETGDCRWLCAIMSIYNHIN